LPYPQENFIIIKNLFGTNIEKKEDLEDMNTILASIKKRIDDCSMRLPDKTNIHHLELFSKHLIPEMEDKMFLIANKFNSCEEELKKKDKQTIRVEKEIQHLGHVLKLAASFKDMPKQSSKHYVPKDPEDKKN
jgi:hypothetical protein